jgi:hypothetical protein
MTFEITLIDLNTEIIPQADGYELEGPLTTLFHLRRAHTTPFFLVNEVSQLQNRPDQLHKKGRRRLKQASRKHDQPLKAEYRNMTNSHASDDPLLGFDWSVQDERHSDSKSAPSPKFEKKNLASPDAQFPIFADNSRPGRAKSPYHENAMAKKPQHLCGALQYFSIVQFGYAVFMFFIWAYTITILGVSGLNAAFYLTFIGICSVSGWKIQNLELFGISLAWAISSPFGYQHFLLRLSCP